MSKRIALFFDRPYFEAHFCFREMAVQFLEHQWQVDLFIPFSLEHPSPSIRHENFSVKFYQKSKSKLIKLLAQLSCWGQNTRYQAIIATPQWALYWAVQVGKLCKIPVICLADEVYTSDEKTLFPSQRNLPSSVMLRWKKREAWANQQCLLTIALSEERYQLTKQENNLSDDHQCIVIPNSPSKTNLIKSSFYRESLEISNHKHILLHSGNGAWSLIDELLQKSSLWLQDFHIVFQGRYKGTLQEKKPGQNVSISPWVLPSNLMHFATSSADIGLMLYDRQREEEVRNGATAGKLGLYLGSGLPILCCNIDSLKWVSEERCGLWVNNIDEIPQAARAIIQDINTYKKNAYRIFLDKFEYSQHFSSLINFINS